MNGEENQRKKNILYIVIGILTLVVAVTSATFAYFMASDTVNNVITGNMATIEFDVNVEKKTNVDNAKGLIPMTNSMVEKATSNASTKGICVDDNHNAVCQIYKITIHNGSTASMFFDGYVSLTGGSGVPTDYVTSPTTMRWAQVFCSETNGELSNCTTAGSSTVRQSNTTGFTWKALGSDHDGQLDQTEIFDTLADVTDNASIQGNSYVALNRNYIRVSKHTGEKYYRQADITSALVYNQYLTPVDDNVLNDDGDSNTIFADAQVYYIVVWLSETGTNQTIGSNGNNIADSADHFFTGSVTFTSAQGGEVTATFGNYAVVTPDTLGS